MTEAQRVGQLFMLGLAGDRLGSGELYAIQRYHVGSVWLTETTGASASQIRAVANQVQAQATTAATGRVRFYFGANQEGGRIHPLMGPGFSPMPSALVQGGMNPSALQSAALGWGRELTAAGVNINFAPVMDVVPPGTDQLNEPIGVLQREFGHDPATVTSHGLAFFRGMRQAGQVTSAKHFPGLGRVRANTDFAGDVVDDRTTADDPYLQTFRQAISAGVPMVMVALATYTRIDAQHLAVFSPTIITGLLRQQLHFGGVVISDDMGAAVAVENVPAGDRAIQFLEAGGDMIVSKTVDPAIVMARAILSRATADRSFASRVNEAALRILRVKQASGLLPCSG